MSVATGIPWRACAWDGEFREPMSAAEHYFTAQQVGDVTVVRLASNLRVVNANNFPPLADRLRELLQQSNTKKVLLNLDRVEYLHSLGIGFLVELSRNLTTQEGSLRLCNVQPEVTEALTLTKVKETLDIRDSEEAALEGF